MKPSDQSYDNASGFYYNGYATKYDNSKSPVKNDFTEIDEGVSWRNFTQNTTFHGIKYVFGDATSMVRR